ncbi:hypothetical protein HTZ77_32150 [Nonomuraea sp. SMC257]|uniref:Uncharacterized protein n=1 Tax=Nonomuraea montanisoli TaxID=2741721 RepID=A0A7Y6ID66_9ACTN|nr:hypothetical protein [Nonomuraea montanisoli]NUW36037.1 hypothetical protein [Nonomuraea montanisoli]
MTRRIVEKTVRETSVLRLQDAEEKVEAVLRDRLPLRGEGVEVVRATVALTTDDETVRAAKRVQRLLHEQELDELARRQVKARADFLREVMFADPASARLYAMLDIPERIGGAREGMDVDEVVRRLNEWSPRSRWVVTAQILYDFVNGLSESGREDLLKIVASAIATLGTTEQADEFLHTAHIAEDPLKR